MTPYVSDPPRQTRSSMALCLLLLLLVAAGPLGLWMLQSMSEPPLDLLAMTFNIRQGNGKDGDNRWEFRKDFVCDVIRDETPDVIGLQEVYHFQLEHLLQHLPQYGAVGTGRDGSTKGEYSPILYLKNRFAVAESGTFWLSDTPAVPSSSWGNDYRRLCTWARLVDKSTRRAFTIYNTHLDHQSQQARENGTCLIMQTIASRPSPDPIIFCGDLNAGEDSDLVAYLKGITALESANPIPLVDTWRVVHPENPDSGTVSRFNGSREPMKIDYIMATPDTRVLSSRILRMHRDGRYPSDHYPVTAHLKLK